MYEIVFFRDRKGHEPVYEYMKELAESNSKDSRIKLTKIREFIKALAANGTLLPETYVKHLDEEIWELRPLRDRILFAAAVGGRFVLLHVFMKQTRKTPAREIARAKRELQDFIERGGNNGY